MYRPWVKRKVMHMSPEQGVLGATCVITLGPGIMTMPTSSPDSSARTYTWMHAKRADIEMRGTPHAHSPR